MPFAALVGLVLVGDLGILPACVAGAAVLASTVLASAIWSRDLGLILDALHRPNGGGVPSNGPRPWLPTAARVEREARYVARALALRAGEVERLLRAEAGIVERLPDPLLVLGADRGVRRANAAARALFGADMGAAMRHPELRGAIESALSGEAVRSAAVAFVGPVSRELDVTVIPLDPPLAGGGHAIAILSDRTRERAIERMRADFVANASHELRTPLASLIGFIETLRGPARDDPPAQERFLGIMADQAARMNRLIDDLLHLSRIEVVEHRPPEEDVDLPPLLRRVADALEPRAAQRRVRLVIDVPDTLPRVAGDEDQLEQVVQNLLDNAVKYGREGGLARLTAAAVPADLPSVRPTVPSPAASPTPSPALAPTLTPTLAPTLTPTLGGSGRWPPRPGVAIQVEDDGPGIPAEHIPRLTERFYRVSKGRSRAVGGTGLGLAIVKHVVNRHRGRLTIESKVGEGSRFIVWLPQRER